MLEVLSSKACCLANTAFPPLRLFSLSNCPAIAVLPIAGVRGPEGEEDRLLRLEVRLGERSDQEPKLAMVPSKDSLFNAMRGDTQ